MHEEAIDIVFAREVLTFLEEYNLFGEHLALSIRLSSLSASQLAKVINVTPAAISQWCNGKRLPDSGMIYKIAKRLHLSQEQHQSLMTAWTSTRFFRGYVEYLEAAISENDLETIRDIMELTMSKEDTQDSFSKIHTKQYAK